MARRDAAGAAGWLAGRGPQQRDGVPRDLRRGWAAAAGRDPAAAADSASCAGTTRFVAYTGGSTRRIIGSGRRAGGSVRAHTCTLGPPHARTVAQRAIRTVGAAAAIVATAGDLIRGGA